MLLLLLFLLTHSKRDSNVMAAADGTTACAILASLSPSVMLLFRQKRRSTGPATCARMLWLQLMSSNQTARMLEGTRRVWTIAGS